MELKREASLATGCYNPVALVFLEPNIACSWLCETCKLQASDEQVCSPSLPEHTSPSPTVLTATGFTFV